MGVDAEALIHENLLSDRRQRRVSGSHDDRRGDAASDFLSVTRAGQRDDTIGFQHLGDHFAHPRARFILNPLGDTDKRYTGWQEFAHVLTDRTHPVRGNGQHHQLRLAQR